MPSLVRYVPEDREIDLACLNPADYELITSLHGSIHRKDGLVLECLTTGGDRALYVWRDNDTGKFWARHFAGSAHGSHEVKPESDEHKRKKSYWVRSAEHAGLQAATEFSTGRGTRLDVVIKGGLVPTGIEVQRAAIPQALVKTRTTKSFRAGYTTAWFHDAGPPPKYLTDVPSLGCNPMPWHERMPNPGEVKANGLGVVEATRCEVGAFDRCPEGNSRPCGKDHPHRSPWHGLAVDDVAAMLPAGEIVPLQARNGVHLVSPDSFALYQELTDGEGLWVPGGKASPQLVIEGQQTKACYNPLHWVPYIFHAEDCEQLVLNPPPEPLAITKYVCTRCGSPGRLYNIGWRCESHSPGALRRSA